MLTLVNANRMRPPIAPLGLDYVGCAARAAGIEVDLYDASLAADPEADLRAFFSDRSPRLVGVSLRNVDDSFWPAATWFVPEAKALVDALRTLTSAPIVVGGVGFSIFGARALCAVGADFGVRGDGELAIVELYRALVSGAPLSQVPGLIWRRGAELVANPPAWRAPLSVPSCRDFIDNRAYFRRGGQGGVETKRGCPRRCSYCADPLTKGRRFRPRPPREVADEVEALLHQGIDVLHICDGEFNVPRRHALAVCQELHARGLGDRVGWYAYAAVTPFDAELAGWMRRAGCLGVDFTGDSGSDTMLELYVQAHRKQDLADAVRNCREHGMACMVDLLLGGPGETPETAAETVSWMKEIAPDCVGASLGVRLYPDTPIVRALAACGPLETLPGLRRRYDGPVDLLRPTFFVSPALGPRPAALVRELVGADKRFFLPSDDADGGHASDDHNYNAHLPLSEAIERGARGAYWNILRQL
jgi:radical SAM superfamily enzyme YgiQ (UPF0313 family)